MKEINEMRPATLVTGYGAILKELRVNAELTQKALGDMCGIPSHQISLFERENNTPTYGELEKIMKSLETPIDKLVYGKVSSDPSAKLLVSSREGVGVTKKRNRNANKSPEDIKLENIARFHRACEYKGLKKWEIADTIGISRQEHTDFIATKFIDQKAYEKIMSWIASVEEEAGGKKKIEKELTKRAKQALANKHELFKKFDKPSFTISAASKKSKEDCVKPIAPQSTNNVVQKLQVELSFDNHIEADVQQCLLMMEPQRITVSMVKLIARNRYLELGGDISNPGKANQAIDQYTLRIVKKLLRSL